MLSLSNRLNSFVVLSVSLLLLAMDHSQYSVNTSYLILSVGIWFVLCGLDRDYIATSASFLLLVMLFFVLLWNKTEAAIMHLYVIAFGVLYCRSLCRRVRVLNILVTLDLMCLLIFFIGLKGLYFEWNAPARGTLLNSSVAILTLRYISNSTDRTTKMLIYFTAIYMFISVLYKSRLLFLVSSIFLIFDFFRIIKVNTFIKVLFMFSLSIGASLLIWVKRASVIGRLTIWQFFLDNMPSHFLGFTPFSFWYTNTIIKTGNEDIANLIGEVYNTAFNEYIQIYVEYGLVPVLVFSIFNLFILYFAVKHRKWVILVSLTSMNLMLVTSYPFMYPNSLFFVSMVYSIMFTSVLPFFDNSVNLRVEKIIEKYRGVKIKWGVSMLVAVCLVIYYIPRYSFTSSFNASSVSREWLLRPLNRYVLSAYDYKYYVLKKTQWENPVIAEQMFEVLKTEYLSYDVLIIGAEVKEYLGKYEESLGYYNQASLVRPFTLFPKYKRLLIYNHLGDVTSRVRVLKEIDSLNLRIQNEVTNKMLEEISEIRSSTQVN